VRWHRCCCLPDSSSNSSDHPRRFRYASSCRKREKNGKKVSFIHLDVMFFVNVNIHISLVPDIAAAVNHTAATPHPTFPAAIDDI